MIPLEMTLQGRETVPNEPILRKFPVVSVNKLPMKSLGVFAYVARLCCAGSLPSQKNGFVRESGPVNSRRINDATCDSVTAAVGGRVHGRGTVRTSGGRRSAHRLGAFQPLPVRLLSPQLSGPPAIQQPLPPLPAGTPNPCLQQELVQLLSRKTAIPQRASFRPGRILMTASWLGHRSVPELADALETYGPSPTVLRQSGWLR